jgi:hypothetical protein
LIVWAFLSVYTSALSFSYQGTSSTHSFINEIHSLKFQWNLKFEPDLHESQAICTYAGRNFSNQLIETDIPIMIITLIGHKFSLWKRAARSNPRTNQTFYLYICLHYVSSFPAPNNKHQLFQPYIILNKQ